MAWKLRKDKLKAGAPEAETPSEATGTPETATAETEGPPVFDLSGSAFHPEPVEMSGEEPEIPSFLDDNPIALVTASGIAEQSAAEPIELEPLPIETAKHDPVMTPPIDAEQEETAIALPAFSPETEDTQIHPAGPAQDAEAYPNLTPEREAIAPGLVTTETETGLPKVAPFILDTPAMAPAPEPPRMHSVVIRIGKLSGTHFLTKDVTTIGRPDSVVQNYPDIEVELDDGISRRHAEIRAAGGDYLLVDVGSTNGTILNGETLKPHQPAVLHSGDRIRIGELTELLFE